MMADQYDVTNEELKRASAWPNGHRLYVRTYFKRPVMECACGARSYLDEYRSAREAWLDHLRCMQVDE